ncbi:MAG: RNA polymerase sigma factor [Thermoleophilaceae bacterium]
MTTQPESNDIPLDRRSDDELVRTFAEGRGSNDLAKRRAALRAWHVLMARYHARVVGWVTLFRFPERPYVVVAPTDRDDVVQQAHERCLDRLAHNFRGTTAAEFRAALKRCVQYTCMDHCRTVMRREMGLAGSIDEAVSADGGDELGRFDAPLARRAARLEDGRYGAALDMEAVGRALDKVPNEDMRAVIRLTIEGYSSKEIAGEIGKNVANVDQLRSRGMRELKGLLGDE